MKIIKIYLEMKKFLEGEQERRNKQQDLVTNKTHLVVQE
jgi:hypothetical protein